MDWVSRVILPPIFTHAFCLCKCIWPTKWLHDLTFTLENLQAESYYSIQTSAISYSNPQINFAERRLLGIAHPQRRAMQRDSAGMRQDYQA